MKTAHQPDSFTRATTMSSCFQVLPTSLYKLWFHPLQVFLHGRMVETIFFSMWEKKSFLVHGPVQIGKQKLDGHTHLL